MEQMLDPAKDKLGTRFLRWCGQAWSAATESEMIAVLDDETVRQIAQDFSITPSELVRLAKAGPHAADEMLAMMRVLNVDPVEASLLHPALFRDMQLNCSRCGQKARCRSDLAIHRADTQFPQYCANAETLNAMRAEPDLLLG